MKNDYQQMEWNEFLDSFFQIIESACENYKKELNVAIVYNMKHAIEIFIKTLIRIADDHSEEKIKNHDLNLLFKSLVQKLKNKKIQKVIKELNDTEESLASFTQQEIKEIEKTLDKIKQIIQYYNELEFLDKKSISLVDLNNTAFKYPENKTQIYAKIDYFDFFFTYQLDIEKIKEDIRNLRIHFNSIKTILQVYHLNKKI